MKFHAKLTLGRKIALLVAVGLTTGVVIFSFLGVHALNRAKEAMLQDRMTTARLVADYLDEALGKALDELQKTSKEIGNGEIDSDFASQMDSLEETYQRLSIYIHGIYIVNEKKRIIWSKPQISALNNLDVSYYPDINQAIEKGEAKVSALVSAPLDNSPVVFLVASLGEGQEEISGALVVAIDPVRSSIGGFVQPIRLGQSGYVEIVEQNGIVVARTEPGPQLEPFEKSDHSGRFADLIAAGMPTSGLCHSCHEPVQKVERRDILAFVPLTEARWGVIIRQSENEALDPIRDLRQSLVLAGTGLTLFAILSIFLITKDVVGRIGILITAARRIAGGDMSTPVTSSQADEVGILARTFEGMRIKLKDSYKELEQKTKELSSLLSVSEILSPLADLSDLDSALSSALNRTLETMKVNSGAILILDKESQMLCCRANYGLYNGESSKICCHLGEGIAGEVVRTGKASVIEDVMVDSRIARRNHINLEKIRTLVSVPLCSKEAILGVITIASQDARKFTSDDIRLLTGIAREIAIAVESAELHLEVQRKEVIRGELLEDIFAIQEEERKRISRELHDETSQVLASLNANLEAASGMLPAGTNGVKAILKKAQNQSINMLDNIYKLIYDLRPSVLDDMGLSVATRWLLENNLEAVGVSGSLKVVGRRSRLPSQLETTLFRVIQEAIYNIAKHARAKNVAITLYFRKKSIKVLIKDDGSGFDVAEALSSKERPRGLGLLGMKERIELVNGTIQIRSQFNGGGTEISIEVPLNKEVSSE